MTALSMVKTGAPFSDHSNVFEVVTALGSLAYPLGELDPVGGGVTEGAGVDSVGVGVGSTDSSVGLGVGVTLASGCPSANDAIKRPPIATP